MHVQLMGLKCRRKRGRNYKLRKEIRGKKEEEAHRLEMGPINIFFKSLSATVMIFIPISAAIILNFPH